MNLKPSDAREAANVLIGMASMSRGEADGWLNRATDSEANALLEIARMPRRSTLLARLLDAQTDRLEALAAAQANEQSDSEPDTELE